MELIPIVQDSLLLFIAILVVVIFISYLFFKLNSKKELENAHETEIALKYNQYLSEQIYKAEYPESIPQYVIEPQSFEFPLNKSNKESKALAGRFTVLNESNSAKEVYYKPGIKEFNKPIGAAGLHPQKSLALFK